MDLTGNWTCFGKLFKTMIISKDGCSAQVQAMATSVIDQKLTFAVNGFKFVAIEFGVTGMVNKFANKTVMDITYRFGNSSGDECIKTRGN